MKYAALAITALAASPALAHSGAHLHPHGAENWLAVTLAAATLVGTAVLAHRRGRK